MRCYSERHVTMMLGLTPHGFFPKDHTRPRIKPLVESVFRRMSPLFDEIYGAGCRPSILPEHVLDASQLMGFSRLARSARLASSCVTTCC